MEKIIKEINDKIREITQSEEIDTQKLTELINTRDRLKSYSTTSVVQIQGFGNNAAIPAIPPPFQMHRNSSIYDGMVDVAEKLLKVQSDKIESKNKTSIHDLMFYHKFVSELPLSINKEESNDKFKIKILTNKVIDDERFDIKEGIEQLIIKELKNIINKEKNLEKDKILETTSEIKDIEKPTLTQMEAQT